MDGQRKLTADDARVALRDHVRERARAARTRYGERIGLDEVLALLEDREFVRYPTDVAFDSSLLEPGEFAWAQQLGESPSSGFRIVVHESFRDRADVLPLLIAYHLVRVNYGDIATHEEAEHFGATLLGMDADVYYGRLCEFADSLTGFEV